MIAKRGSTFKWSAESISAFWDEVADDEDLSQIYFTKYNAEFIEFVARLICEAKPQSTSILDYGCGAGFLSESLLKKGYATTSLDFSMGSCIRTEERLNGLNHRIICAKSLPTPLAKNSFDLVYSVETLEHLLDEWVEPYFEELFRLVRPGGNVLITAPFSEHLGYAKCICPECHSKFHRWGHIRSLSITDMVHQASKAGFRTVFVKNIEIETLNNRFIAGNKSLYDCTIREIADSIRNRFLLHSASITGLASLKKHIKLKEGNNLIYIGQKQ